MQVTCQACFLNFDAAGPGARCPACGAAAPMGGPVPGAGAWGAPGGAYGSPPAAGAYAGPAGPVSQPGEVVSTAFLVWNILMTLFCQPAGIISFVLCDQAKTLARSGRWAEAQAKVKSARTALWIGAGVSFGLIGLYVVFIVAVVATATRR